MRHRGHPAGPPAGSRGTSHRDRRALGRSSGHRSRAQKAPRPGRWPAGDHGAGAFTGEEGPMPSGVSSLNASSLPGGSKMADWRVRFTALCVRSFCGLDLFHLPSPSPHGKVRPLAAYLTASGAVGGRGSSQMLSGVTLGECSAPSPRVNSRELPTRTPPPLLRGPNRRASASRLGHRHDSDPRVGHTFGAAVLVPGLGGRHSGLVQHVPQAGLQEGGRGEGPARHVPPRPRPGSSGGGVR